jgi:hypothetical protein
MEASGFPSKATISRVRYGFSFRQQGQRRLKTWDFLCKVSISSFEEAWKLPTIAGTGMGALQCKHTTPRKVERSVSLVISALSPSIFNSFGVPLSYPKGGREVYGRSPAVCGNDVENADFSSQQARTQNLIELSADLGVSVCHAEPPPPPQQSALSLTRVDPRTASWSLGSATPAGDDLSTGPVRRVVPGV